MENERTDAFDYSSTVAYIIDMHFDAAMNECIDDLNTSLTLLTCKVRDTQQFKNFKPSQFDPENRMQFTLVMQAVRNEVKDLNKILDTMAGLQLRFINERLPRKSAGVPRVL
jgi:hypothetical protein